MWECKGSEIRGNTEDLWEQKCFLSLAMTIQPKSAFLCCISVELKKRLTEKLKDLNNNKMDTYTYRYMYRYVYISMYIIFTSSFL